MHNIHITYKRYIVIDMKLTKDKKEALLIICLALVLHAIATVLIKNTYGYKLNHSIEGSGLLVSIVGLYFWIYGFLKYARAKGRSELLALFLSLFWLAGLAVLLMLQDIKKPKKA